MINDMSKKQLDIYSYRDTAYQIKMDYQFDREQWIYKLNNEFKKSTIDEIPVKAAAFLMVGSPKEEKFAEYLKLYQLEIISTIAKYDANPPENDFITRYFRQEFRKESENIDNSQELNELFSEYEKIQSDLNDVAGMNPQYHLGIIDLI